MNGYLCPENIDIYTKTLADLILSKRQVEYLAEGAFYTAMDYRQEAVALKASNIYNRVIAEYYEIRQTVAVPVPLSYSFAK